MLHHDPVTTMDSFINTASNPFYSIYNLPYGIFTETDTHQPRVGTAIGDYVLDLSLLESSGLLTLHTSFPLFNQASLNLFASQGPRIWAAARHRIQTLLLRNNHELQDNSSLLERALIPVTQTKMLMPFAIGAYTDFYASIHHATNVGKLFRGNENALLPNWKYLPVGYNGRASTVYLSGTDVRRPNGQIKTPQMDTPIFSACKKLDFELELGVFIGVGNPDARPIAVDTASSHIFGLVLLNDWSARDIQAFEYQPLGPFLSKSFATSISPWVVTLDAITPFSVTMPQQVPQPVTYLQQAKRNLFDIKLKVEIQTRECKEKTTICETNCKELYWSLEQLLAHHTINNCILHTGDLLGTGTISGEQPNSVGSLLELTQNGANPILLTSGNQRTFLEDGDSVIFTAYCESEHKKIGFGSLAATIIANT